MTAARPEHGHRFDEHRFEGAALLQRLVSALRSRAEVDADEPVRIPPPIAEIVMLARTEAAEQQRRPQTARAGASCCATLIWSLSDLELRAAWRLTYVRLRRLERRPRRGIAIAAIRLERTWYREEIERRAAR